MTRPPNILALFAHPDDAKFLCAGTLAQFAAQGARIHLATLTAGDCGSTILPATKIARVRRREAARAAKLIGAKYRCVNEKDLSVFYDRHTIGKVMELVRRVRPTIVFTHSPVDYMADHENTSRLCQTACFGAMAPNYQTGARQAAKPLSRVPHLYYADAFGQRDIFGDVIPSRLFVDIGATLECKEEMLACHQSQQDWLESQQGIPEMLTIMRRLAAETGKRAGFRWAEGYRQHLGQGFPSSNLLKELLGKLVR